MAEIHDLRITISEPDIADLRERLKRTRWPDAETVSDWSQGIPSSYVRELAGYWAENYDMNRLAERLNAYPNYHATLGDLGVHFLHVRSPHDGARPLILTHGWPGSVLEFLDVIGPLTEPERFGGAVEDAFHVVIPSLPGYGFSAKPTITGVGIERIADAWDELMAALGYHGYYAQGGDWGAFVTTAMGIKRPAGLLGIHVNMALASPEALAGLGELTPDEQAVGDCRRTWSRRVPTPCSRPPARRRWGMGSPTRPSVSSLGSPRSSTPGRIVTDIRRRPWRAMSFWTM